MNFRSHHLTIQLAIELVKKQIGRSKFDMFLNKTNLTEDIFIGFLQFGSDIADGAIIRTALDAGEDVFMCIREEAGTFEYMYHDDQKKICPRYSYKPCDYDTYLGKRNHKPGRAYIHATSIEVVNRKFSIPRPPNIHIFRAHLIKRFYEYLTRIEPKIIDDYIPEYACRRLGIALHSIMDSFTPSHTGIDQGDYEKSYKDQDDHLHSIADEMYRYKSELDISELKYLLESGDFNIGEIKTITERLKIEVFKKDFIARNIFVSKNYPTLKDYTDKCKVIEKMRDSTWIFTKYAVDTVALVIQKALEYIDDAEHQDGQKIYNYSEKIMNEWHTKYTEFWNNIETGNFTSKILIDPVESWIENVIIEKDYNPNPILFLIDPETYKFALSDGANVLSDHEKRTFLGRNKKNNETRRGLG